MEAVEYQPPTIEFFGEQFQVAEKIGLMPLLRFAKAAKAGADSADLESLTVMYDLLEQVIAPSEWERFQKVADDNRADGEELMQVVSTAIELLTARPTSRPSASSDGPPTTSTNSTDVSYLRVKQRLEQEGRPDQAYVAMLAHRARSTA